MSQIGFYKELYPASMSKSVEMITKRLVKQDILDNEESQSAVHDYIIDPVLRNNPSLAFPKRNDD